MKTRFIITLAALAICACAYSQTTQPENIKKERTFPNDRMIKELKLSEKQVAEFKKANVEFKAEMQAFKDKEKLSRKERIEAINKIRDEHRATIRKCLSTEQYINYLERQINQLQAVTMRSRQKGHKGGNANKDKCDLKKNNEAQPNN